MSLFMTLCHSEVSGCICCVSLLYVTVFVLHYVWPFKVYLGLENVMTHNDITSICHPPQILLYFSYCGIQWLMYIFATCAFLLCVLVWIRSKTNFHSSATDNISESDPFNMFGFMTIQDWVFWHQHDDTFYLLVYPNIDLSIWVTYFTENVLYFNPTSMLCFAGWGCMFCQFFVKH